MQQTNTKRLKDQTRLGEEGDPLGIVQEIAARWYMHKPESVLENEAQNSLGFFRYKQIT